MMPVRDVRLMFMTIFCLCFGMVSTAHCAETIRISSWRLPFNIPVMLERQTGRYQKTFPDMRIEEIDLRTGPRLMSAIAAGDLDIAQGVGDAAFLIAASAGVDARIVAVNSRSPKAFAVVTNNPEVRTVRDLKGRRVAGMRGSVVHEVFMKAMGENGLNESDVEFFPMPVPQASASLLAGRTDAALLVGSEIIRALNAGGRVLADGEGRVPGLSFVIARTGFIRDHPEAVRRFLGMRADTLTMMKRDAGAVLRIAAGETGLGSPDIGNMLKWYDFDSRITEKDRASLRETQSYLLQQKIITKKLDSSSLFWKANR